MKVDNYAIPSKTNPNNYVAVIYCCSDAFVCINGDYITAYYAEDGLETRERIDQTAVNIASHLNYQVIRIVVGLEDSDDMDWQADDIIEVAVAYINKNGVLT